MDINNLINKEVRINNRDGEIIRILGVDFVEIEFFNMNDEKCVMPIKDIDKYFV